jgi:hypothetical protein
MDSYTDLVTKVNQQTTRIFEIYKHTGFPRDKIIVIPRNAKYGKDNVLDYAASTVTYIVQQLKQKSWDCKIIFDLPDEGFATIPLKLFDIVTRQLILDYNISPKNIIYITGAAAVPSSTIEYNKLCIKMNYFPISVYYTNGLEINQRTQGGEFRDTFHSREPNRKKKFLCYNRNPRPHRVALLAQLLKRDLVKHGYLSFNADAHSVKGSFNQVKRIFPNLINDTTLNIRPMLNDLPINLSLVENHPSMFYPSDTDIMMYKSSLFSIVTETLFENNTNYQNEDDSEVAHCYPIPMFSEKTWKTIRGKHPFILATVPHSLRAFRELGYRTFHPYIDETYDTIENEEERLLAIVNEVDRLCNMSDNDTREWLYKVHEITDHNFQKLSEATMYIKEVW